jgi:hypothetical protein
VIHHLIAFSILVAILGAGAAVLAAICDAMDRHDEATRSRLEWEEGRDAEARCVRRAREYGQVRRG